MQATVTHAPPIALLAHFLTTIALHVLSTTTYQAAQNAYNAHLSVITALHLLYATAVSKATSFQLLLACLAHLSVQIAAPRLRPALFVM